MRAYARCRMPFRLHNHAQGRTVGECVRCCWEVRFACENGHGGRFGAIELSERFPAEATLEQIAARLVCKTCGSTDGEFTTLNDQGASQARDAARFSGETKPVGKIRPQG